MTVGTTTALEHFTIEVHSDDILNSHPRSHQTSGGCVGLSSAKTGCCVGKPRRSQQQLHMVSLGVCCKSPTAREIHRIGSRMLSK